MWMVEDSNPWPLATDRLTAERANLLRHGSYTKIAQTLLLNNYCLAFHTFCAR